jgi:SAM-dependent methyltransferase
MVVNTSEGLDSAVDRLYRHRFPAAILARRSAVWAVLCESWFSRYLPDNARVIEVAAGYCEFINNIRASEKVAVDINPETTTHAASGVTVYQVTAERIGEVVPGEYFDAAFMSNFLEHCHSRSQILAIFHAVASVLKPGGRFLILGPNFRYCYKEYFDFFDHHLPLTEKAVVEGLQIAGFNIDVVQPRTLPFSFRSNLPSSPWLVWLYCRLRFLWPLFGAQFFIVAQKPTDTGSMTSL